MVDMEMAGERVVYVNMWKIFKYVAALKTWYE